MKTKTLVKHKSQILSQFKCQQTGNCCRADGVVYASPKEVQEMAKSLKIDVHEFVKYYTKRKNGWTIVADTTFRPNCFLTPKNLCKVYESRPKKCQTYPNWPEIWESDDALIEETTLCPALKQATKPFKVI